MKSSIQNRKDKLRNACFCIKYFHNLNSKPGCPISIFGQAGSKDDASYLTFLFPGFF